MGKKKRKKNKHKKKKWLSFLGFSQGKEHTPYYNDCLVDVYYCMGECEALLVNKKKTRWDSCPSCHSDNRFYYVGKKDIHQLI